MPRVITLGAEVEYVVLIGHNIHTLLNNEDLNRLSLELEYYTHMVEFNEILLSTNLSVEGINEALKSISAKMKEKAKEIKRFLNRKGKRSWRVYISAIPFKKYDGLVFNGIHLHLGYIVRSERRLNWFKKLAVYWKYKNNPDLRFLTSHHIWGNHRPSNYSFKRRPKFSPVIVTSHGTVEFRCFSFEDIAIKHVREKLANFLFHLTYYHKRYIRRERFIEKVCESQGWSIEEVERFWQRQTNKRCEYIPSSFNKNIQLTNRIKLYEKLENNTYIARVYTATNSTSSDNVVVTRKTLEFPITT